LSSSTSDDSEENEAKAMRSVVNTPAGVEPVEIRTVEEPAPGPAEFVIEVAAISVNRSEPSGRSR
jgi:NADPH:quinone reductase-like Zn-dependent oxidoreductase